MDMELISFVAGAVSVLLMLLAGLAWYAYLEERAYRHLQKDVDKLRSKWPGPHING